MRPLISKTLFWLVVAVPCIGAVHADTGIFVSGDANIFYVDEGMGEPVVLIHGYTSDHDRAWVERGIFDALVSEGFRVLTFDHRGHGRSDWPQRPEDFGLEMVADVRRFLEYREIDRAHIVGYSMGGRIAGKFRELHPEKVISLSLGGIGLPFGKPIPSNEAEIAEMLVRRGSNLDSRSLASIVAAYDAFEPDLSVYRSNHIPTLVSVGIDDRLYGLNITERARVLANTMAESAFVVVPGNHGNAPSSREYLDAVISFLRTHSSGIAKE
jgi:pimeloyl-ACP methyl ester carboxylesterase